MKVYLKRPAKELQIVKPDRNDMDYEFWVLVPVQVGGARRAGTQRILADNGHEYINLAEAARDAVESAKQMDGLEKFFDIEAPRGHKVTGIELAATGAWPKFAAMRKLNPTDLEAMKAAYLLTDIERKKLGVKK